MQYRLDKVRKWHYINMERYTFENFQCQILESAGISQSQEPDMARDYKDEIIRVTDMGDPERCQGIRGGKSGDQCINKSLEHSDYCPVHGGNKGEEAYAKKSARNYRLQQWKWRNRLDELAEGSNIKSLREEIGILRILMEERLSRINDATDMIIQSGPISDLVLKIDRVVNSCHKLEGSMGQLLDKSAVLQFANVAIDIISEAIPDQEIVSQIADKLINALASQGKEEDETL
jgi:hypothetical protein